MNFKKLPILILLFNLLFNCYNDGDDDLTSSKDINNFVWKGMNSWYFWQKDVPNLADDVDNNSTAYNELLNTFTDPEDFFKSLRFDYGETDRFSWFIEDYIAQLQAFQGISKTFGFDFEAVRINDSDDVILYVSYVANNSPAKSANIKRGDIINAIDDTVINIDNFRDLVGRLSGDNVKLTFVAENNGVLDFIEDKSISAAIISENPVHFSTIFNDVAGRKVGYLVYTGFRSSYNDELNDAFEHFKNEGIDELILDLRLNGGGSVGTSAYLASMIYADAGTDVFAELRYNAKHTNENDTYNFANTLNVFDDSGTKTGEQNINRLNSINRLYVLTSENTASASELIINGLRPFLYVKLFGTTTFGKNVGSTTLFDSPKSDYRDRRSANQSHLYAMQPIVFQSFNKDGESDYTQGFEPNVEIKEYLFWNNILPFGNENEVVLKAALDDIRGTITKTIVPQNKSTINSKRLKTPSKKFETEMFVE
ncbi:S41 family peptidase [Seonamhaeicola marinus]|uniref:Peptidase S41 n=1 Tax=Seonamhaeicola marinus TaxID=1912246 RepID=A0A5D0J9N3_9FLAO|nr:S41 family peptidase [Seonamhaeicola marinus]TYA92221.1 peptidase S41 [Seonamhaeicola marinus]